METLNFWTVIVGNRGEEVRKKWENKITTKGAYEQLKKEEKRWKKDFFEYKDDKQFQDKGGGIFGPQYKLNSYVEIIVKSPWNLIWPLLGRQKYSL